MSRSIIQRLNPANPFGPVQYLHVEWETLPVAERWTVLREEACEFDRQSVAQDLSLTMPYQCNGCTLHPFAVVLCLEEKVARERRKRHRDREAQQEASIPPSECYERTRKRLGERE